MRFRREKSFTTINTFTYLLISAFLFSLGEESHRLLSELSAADRSIFFSELKIIYYAIAEYLKSRLPLKNKFSRDVQICDPSLRTESNAADQMVRVVRAVPGLLTPMKIDRIRDERMMYANETIDESWFGKNRY